LAADTTPTTSCPNSSPPSCAAWPEPCSSRGRAP
jgi:hypothetical protein